MSCSTIFFQWVTLESDLYILHTYKGVYNADADLLRLKLTSLYPTERQLPSDLFISCEALMETRPRWGLYVPSADFEVILHFFDSLKDSLYTNGYIFEKTFVDELVKNTSFLDNSSTAHLKKFILGIDFSANLNPHLLNSSESDLPSLQQNLTNPQIFAPRYSEVSQVPSSQKISLELDNLRNDIKRFNVRNQH